MVCIWVFGDGVDGEMETCLVAHGCGLYEGFEGGSGRSREAGTGLRDVGAAGIGGRNEGVFVCVV